MNEIGFWDYTCPRNGSLERYTQADWDELLDDMVAGGFNSLVLGIKWLTTGYRSRLPWLDQDSTCTAIASDNRLIHHALRGARQRGIRTWLLVVATVHQAREFGLGAPTAGYLGAAPYDLDCPGLAERIELMAEEVVELFGAEADGFVLEMEFCDHEAPHRIPLYNEWARQNNRPDFATIKQVRLEPRSYPFQHWRDYTTSRRIEIMRRVERVVRGRGFTGKLASIAELANGDFAVLGNVNLQLLRAALPDWSLVTYDSVYDRRLNRLATMDFCVAQPKALGLHTAYLTRGVMTFTWPPDTGPAMTRRRLRLRRLPHPRPRGLRAPRSASRLR